MDISETLLVIDAGNGNERGRTSSTEGQAGSASSGSPSPMNHDFTHTVKNELRLMNRGIAEMNKAVLDLIREMLVSHQRFQKCNEENSQAIVGLTASTNGLKLLIFICIVMYVTYVYLERHVIVSMVIGVLTASLIIKAHRLLNIQIQDAIDSFL